MLPQMMPLPWLFVFFLIFFSVYSVSLYIGSFSFGVSAIDSPLKSPSVNLPW